MEFVIKDKGWTINTGNEIQSGNVWSLNFIFVRKASLKGNELRVIEEKEKQKEKTQQPFQLTLYTGTKNTDIEWHSIEQVVNDSKFFFLRGAANANCLIHVYKVLLREFTS